MEMLQGAWKQHLRPRVVVGYGVKIFLPSPPNYVTRSPGLSTPNFRISLTHRRDTTVSLETGNLFSLFSTFILATSYYRPLDSTTRKRMSTRFDYPLLAKIPRKFLTGTINLTLC